MIAKTTVPLVSLVAALAVASTSCSGDGDDSQTSSKPAVVEGGTYRTAIAEDPGDLNPLKTVSSVANGIDVYAYDSLISVTPDGKVQSRLAEDWEIKPAEVTFTIRDGVTCEDDHQLTARDVAANFEWIADPANGSPKLGSSLPAGFHVKSDNGARTVTVSLDHPFGFLLEGAGGIPIVCPGGLKDPKSLRQDTDGTGPFVMTDYSADDHVTLSARQGYDWGPDGASTDVPGFPAQVMFKVVRDNSTAINLFLAGQLNDAGANGPEQARLESGDFDKLDILGGPYDLFYNQREGEPTANRDVRRALTMGLDLDAVTAVLTERTGKRAGDLTAIAPDPCKANSTSGTIPDYDADQAAALLDSAGWTMGSNGQRSKDGQTLALTVSYVSGTAEDAAMELVRQQWGDLGADVHLKGQGVNAFLSTVFGAEGAWDTSFFNVQIIYPSDFVSLASGATPPEGQNAAAIDNPEYKRLTDKAIATPGDKGCDIWAEAETALFDDLDVVPVATTVSSTYIAGATFDGGWTNYIEPTSIRMYRK